MECRSISLLETGLSGIGQQIAKQFINKYQIMHGGSFIEIEFSN